MLVKLLAGLASFYILFTANFLMFEWMLNRGVKTKIAQFDTDVHVTVDSPEALPFAVVITLIQFSILTGVLVSEAGVKRS